MVLGRYQRSPRGVQLALRCTVLTAQTPEAMTVVGGAEHGPADSDIQSQPVARMKDKSSPILRS